MINWILAFLGIAIYFISKYIGRSNKEKTFSFGFWIKNNWDKSMVSALATIALMLLFLSPDAQFDFSDFFGKIPGVISLPVKGILSLGSGLFNSVWVYALFKTKK